MNELLYWIWLSAKCTPDTPYFSILYHTLGAAENIYNADENVLSEVYGITPKITERLLDKDLSNAQNILKECQRNDIGILPYCDERFPSRLRTINNPPVLIYYKGRLPDFDKEVCIGTVGTRTPTPYGNRCAYEIAFDLALSGAYVISGMAFGIDSVCHKAALDAGGKTVAVLGCGVDVVYPAENKEIYDRLCAHGTLISEYPPGAKATRYSFPQRNRLISGLSLGTLIVEAQLKSGAMITARYANEQNRDLFALPGRVGEYNSLGPNSLIQLGALSVTSARDILKEYEFLYPEKIRYASSEKNQIPQFGKAEKPLVTSIKRKTEAKGQPTSPPPSPVKDEAPSVNFDGLPEEQREICVCLSKKLPLSLEEIKNITNISVSDIMSSLTILEIQGIVKAMPGGYFVLA